MAGAPGGAAQPSAPGETSPPPPGPPPREPLLWPWAALLGIVAVAGVAILLVAPRAAVTEAPFSFPLQNIHWHALIEVEVHGLPVDLGPVPPGANFVGRPWLHHHGDNTAHIESFNFPGGAFTDPSQISLGTFFDAIGVLLTPEQVCFPDSTGCANGRRLRVEVFVNGVRKEDFRNYPLRDRDLVLIRAE